MMRATVPGLACTAEGRGPADSLIAPSAAGPGTHLTAVTMPSTFAHGPRSELNEE